MPQPRRDLIVLALPTGIVTTAQGPAATLTAMFLPRLREAGTLSQYPDWRNWPNGLRRLQFRVDADGSVLRPRIRSRWSTKVWRAVFPPSTEVDPHAYVDRVTEQVTNDQFRSYDGTVVAQQVRDLYTVVAAEFPDGPPDASVLQGLSAAQSLFDGSDFADSGEYHEEVDAGAGTVEAPAFHEWLSLLSTHPALLRALGLAVDLAFPLAPLGAVPSRVRVLTNYNLPETRQTNPWTLTTTDFLAESDPEAGRTEVLDGYLRASVADGIALHQVNLGEAEVRLGALDRQGPVDRPGSGALPDLRSGGVGLVRANAVGQFEARLRRQHDINELLEADLGGTPPPPTLTLPLELYAEDLTAGWRFDIHDDATGLWRSAFGRRPTGPYRFPRDGKIEFTPPPDEGIQTWTLVSEGTETSSVVQKGDPEFPRLIDVRSGVRRIDPSVFTWMGWSAAAPPPSHHLDPALGPQPTEPSEPDTTADVQLAIDYAPIPGSLPRLRFGRTYKMRGRAVDLAGNSVPPDTGDAHPPEVETETEFFGRVERIGSPPVLRRSARPVPGWGNTTLSIVLTSDHDTPDGFVQGDDRILFPPQVPQRLCELHGEPSGGVDKGSYADLVARDGARIEDETVPDPGTGEPLWADGKFTPMPPSTVTYLPDPAVGGVVLTGVPGTTDPLVALHKGVAFPEFPSGLLDVLAGDETPKIQPDADTFFRVWLPKATDTTALLSCAIAADRLDEFDGLFGADKSLVDHAALGQHWLFTQSVPIHLVHAVRRPLLAPELPDPFSASRRLDDPGATLTGPVTIDPSSTGAVTLHAVWEEPQDDGVDPLGRSTRAEQQREDTDAALPAGDAAPDIPARFEFGTTKRLDVTLTAEATSSFVPYFTERFGPDLWGPPELVLDPKGIVARTVEVRAGGQLARRGTDYTIDAPGGTLTRLVGGILDEKTEVTIDYVARPVSRFSDEVPDFGKPGPFASLDVVVPASVAPPAPEVVHVVPAFALTEPAGTNVNVISRTRNGRMVRVWCERPWLVSGDFERLAVVLPDTGVDGTTWARDPGAAAFGAGMPLAAADFPLATVFPSVDGGPDVAAHEVGFDPDRNQWYAEIEVAGDTSYRPWVQLALARHQQDAISGQHLSGIVYPPALRLGALRTYRVTDLGVGSDIEVRVLGDDHDGVPDGSGGTAYNAFTVTVQEHDPGVTDPALAWFDTGQVEPLTRDASGYSWTGTFSIVGVGGATYRLVITETEPVLSEVTGVTTLERVVSSVEAIELPGSFVSGGGGGGGITHRRPPSP